ncbi:hypothetical protein Tco_1008421 [Tanacetum coccineum]
MAEPDLNEYISITRKNYLSDDNRGRMVEKSFLEVQGTFFVKIHDNTFSGTIRENAFEHIEKFLEVVVPLKIRNVSHDRFRLSVFPISLSGAANEWFNKEYIGSVTTWEDLVEKFFRKYHLLSHINEEIKADEDSDEMNVVAEIFKIECNLFDFETPLCKAFDEFNYLLKIDTELFTLDVHEIKTYEKYEYELNNNMTWVLRNRGRMTGYHINCVIIYANHIVSRMGRPNGLHHKWYDNLIDGGLKEDTLRQKTRFKDSWGDAAPGVMKFCAWLKSSFEDFHELDPLDTTYYLFENLHFKYPVCHMAPLPPKDQRHPWLRYQVEGYTEEIVHNFKQRLETIFGRPVNRVHVLDFAGLTEEIMQTLADRLMMAYTGDEGHGLFTSHAWRILFEIRGPLVREFMLEFFSTCRMSDTELRLDEADTLCFQLGAAPSYGYIRDPVRRLCHKMITYSISGRGQALEKHTKGRKNGARLSRGHFIRRLAAHFGLVSDEGLLGLIVIAREPPLIDMDELVKLNICVRIGDTWSWVAPGPERKQATAAGVLKGVEGADVEIEGDQAVPAPLQAPQPPLAA